MTEVMSAPTMDEIGLSPRKDGLSYQVNLLPYKKKKVLQLANCKLLMDSAGIR